NDPESKRELLTYLDLVGRQSKAGQDVIAELKRNRGLIWNTELGAPLSRALLIEGKLIGNNDKQVVALDKNGKVLWRQNGEHILDKVYDSKTRRLFYASAQNRDPKTIQLFVTDIERGDRKEFARITSPLDV